MSTVHRQTPTQNNVKTQEARFTGQAVLKLDLLGEIHYLAVSLTMRSSIVSQQFLADVVRGAYTIMSSVAHYELGK